MIKKPNSSSHLVTVKANILPEKPQWSAKGELKDTQNKSKWDVWQERRGEFQPPQEQICEGLYLPCTCANAYSRRLHRYGAESSMTHLYRAPSPAANSRMRITDREWTQWGQEGGGLINQFPNYSGPHCQGSDWRRCFLSITDPVGRIRWHHVTSHNWRLHFILKSLPNFHRCHDLQIIDRSK